MRPVLILMLALVRAPPIRAAEKPNIVVIFVDDLGYADIGPFGATKQKTPHLDRMASEGMKLTSFYAAPVCSVSYLRNPLISGRITVDPKRTSRLARCCPPCRR